MLCAKKIRSISGTNVPPARCSDSSLEFVIREHPPLGRASFPFTLPLTVWKCPTTCPRALPVSEQVMELKDVNAALVGHKNSRQKIQQVRCGAVQCGPILCQFGSHKLLYCLSIF